MVEAVGSRESYAFAWRAGRILLSGGRKPMTLVLAHLVEGGVIQMPSKMLQVRNIPESLHDELARRARLHRKTLTAYVQEILEREVARADRDDDIWDRIDRLERATVDFSAVDLIREVRDEAEAEWDEWLSTRRP